MTADPITWTNDTRRLSDLVPWEHNPKRMTKKQADGLRLSIERFGFAVPFLVSPTGDIYDGHQRQTLMGAIKEYGPNAVVDVRVSSRSLTDDERRELVVRLKQNQAGWDFDMLPNLYEREELLEWGFEEFELGFSNDEAPTGEDADFADFDPTALDGFVAFKFGDYSGKVTQIVYDSFVEQYKVLQNETGEPMLDDVLRSWLDV